MLRIAVWNTPPAEFLVSRLQDLQEIEIYTGPSYACEKWLADEKVDVALVPTLSIMRDPEPWELIPDIGLASASFPYARLVLRGGLGRIKRVGFDPQYRQEVLLTQIVLQEHYGTVPEFVPYQKKTAEQVLREEGGVLVTDPDTLQDPDEGVVLDIGQEWFELATYPMTWGVFASKADHLSLEQADMLRKFIAGADQIRSQWIGKHQLSEPVKKFMQSDLILRIAGAVDTGLEELAQYLFFHGILEEIPDLPFLIFPEDEEEEEA